MEVGEAIRGSGKKVFVTTKIMESAGDVEANYLKCLDSVKKINVGVIDLFLIHTPRLAKGAQDRKSIWLALERLVKEGHLR